MIKRIHANNDVKRTAHIRKRISPNEREAWEAIHTLCRDIKRISARVGRIHVLAEAQSRALDDMGW